MHVHAWLDACTCAYVCATPMSQMHAFKPCYMSYRAPWPRTSVSEACFSSGRLPLFVQSHSPMRHGSLPLCTMTMLVVRALHSWHQLPHLRRSLFSPSGNFPALFHILWKVYSPAMNTARCACPDDVTDTREFAYPFKPSEIRCCWRRSEVCRPPRAPPLVAKDIMALENFLSAIYFMVTASSCCAIRLSGTSEVKSFNNGSACARNSN